MALTCQKCQKEKDSVKRYPIIMGDYTHTSATTSSYSKHYRTQEISFPVCNRCIYKRMARKIFIHFMFITFIISLTFTEDFGKNSGDSGAQSFGQAWGIFLIVGILLFSAFRSKKKTARKFASKILKAKDRKFWTPEEFKNA